MIWTSTDITNLILVAKDAGINLTTSICRKLDLGKSIDQDIEYLYFISNIVFGLENDGTDVFADEDYSLMSEYINRIANQRNRFRGL